MPHTLFFALSVALPFHWRSGVVLAPLLIAAVGAAALPRSQWPAPASA